MRTFNGRFLYAQRAPHSSRGRLTHGVGPVRKYSISSSVWTRPIPPGFWAAPANRSFVLIPASAKATCPAWSTRAGQYATARGSFCRMRSLTLSPILRPYQSTSSSMHLLPELRGGSRKSNLPSLRWYGPHGCCPIQQAARQYIFQDSQRLSHTRCYVPDPFFDLFRLGCGGLNWALVCETSGAPTGEV